MRTAFVRMSTTIGSGSCGIATAIGFVPVKRLPASGGSHERHRVDGRERDQPVFGGREDAPEERAEVAHPARDHGADAVRPGEVDCLGERGARSPRTGCSAGIENGGRAAPLGNGRLRALRSHTVPRLFGEHGQESDDAVRVHSRSELSVSRSAQADASSAQKPARTRTSWA